ncbi:MAG: nucleotidyltransferase domain-containing protein, partial [Nanoarchaeota archaeon]|nr:nucleotidyltransferase domain-containing protein [Nanoarchaeota archaeon]
MRQNELFSYVYDFVSQLLDEKLIFDSVSKIILFGSVVRGDFRKGSDVDLFVELKTLKEKKKIDHLIKKELNKFETRAEKSWYLRGVNLPIKLLIGNLDQFKDLKEEISSYSKVVYGQYEEIPGRIKHKVLVTYEIKKLSQKNKMSFLRKLFGYVSVKKGKKYVSK